VALGSYFGASSSLLLIAIYVLSPETAGMDSYYLLDITLVDRNKILTVHDRK
jgi:hypothetical protein